MFKCVRKFNIHTKLYTLKKNNFCKSCSVSYSGNLLFTSLKPKNINPLAQINRPSLIQQYRNLSVEKISQFNRSLFDSVAHSDVSIALRNALGEFHDFTGLPWWAVVVFTTFGVRLLFSFPVGIYQQYLLAKIKLTKVELNELRKDLETKVLLQARRGKWNEAKTKIKLALELKRAWSALTVKNNCHPFKVILLSWLQFPVWVLISLSFRKLSEDATNTSVSVWTLLQMKTEGPSWCKDLTFPDSTLILPSILSLGSLTLLEINVLSAASAGGTISRLVTMFLRFFGVASFFISMTVPSCVSLYWTTSILLGLGQNLVFMSPRFKGLLKIPITPIDVAKPYRNVWIKLGLRFSNFIMFFKKIFKV